MNKIYLHHKSRLFCSNCTDPNYCCCKPCRFRGQSSLETTHWKLQLNMQTKNWCSEVTLQNCEKAFTLFERFIYLWTWFWSSDHKPLEVIYFSHSAKLGGGFSVFSLTELKWNIDLDLKCSRCTFKIAPMFSSKSLYSKGICLLLLQQFFVLRHH